MKKWKIADTSLITKHNSQGNTSARILLIDLLAEGLQFIGKNSTTGFFPWILLNFINTCGQLLLSQENTCAVVSFYSCYTCLVKMVFTLYLPKLNFFTSFFFLPTLPSHCCALFLSVGLKLRQLHLLNFKTFNYYLLSMFISFHK